MSTPQSRDTRTAILDTAEDMLQRRSFNSFSYSHISETIGLRKASLHYHFPTKADLGVALLERYRERFGAWREQHAGEAPRAQLETYITAYEGCLSRSQVCVGGVFGVEYNTLDEPIQEGLRLLYEDHHDWLIHLLERGRREGAFAYPGTAEAQAAVVSMALQGALQQARSCGLGRFRLALDQLVALMSPPADEA